MSIFGDPENKARGEYPSLKDNLSRARQAAQPKSSSRSTVPPALSADQTRDRDEDKSIIQEDMTITGTVTNGRNVEIHGLIEGELYADKVNIRKTGKLLGKLSTDNATIEGTIEGEVKVKHLIRISSSGSVTGDIEYGELALDAGGELSAELRNIPPTLLGDLELTVKSGHSVTITTEDLTAIEPDNYATELTYSVSGVRNGHLARSHVPQSPINNFTQADIESNIIQFVHDGTSEQGAGFDVVVTDSEGATSGGAKTILVSVEA